MNYDASLWLIFIVLGLATTLPRASFIVLGNRFSLPPRLQRALRYAPAAALAAIGFGWRCIGAEKSRPPLTVFSKVYQELKLSFEQAAALTADGGLDGIDCPVRGGGEIPPGCGCRHGCRTRPSCAGSGRVITN